jgi:hypothetical protein
MKLGMAGVILGRLVMMQAANMLCLGSMAAVVIRGKLFAGAVPRGAGDLPAPLLCSASFAAVRIERQM